MHRVTITTYCYGISADGTIKRDPEPTVMIFESRDKNHALFLAWNAAFYMPGVASATMESNGKIEGLWTPPAGKAPPEKNTPGLFVHN